MRIKVYVALLGRYKVPLMLAVAVAIGFSAMYSQTNAFATLAGDQGNDDAYISFRYSQNLVEGHGLVYNPGEQAVEGYSNFLYTLMIAGGIAIAGTDWTYQYALLINLTFGLMLLILISRSRHLTMTAKVGAIILTGITPAVAYWAASGLETVPVVAVQVGIVLLTEEIVRMGTRWKTLGGLTILCAVSIFLRADGFLIPLLSTLYLGLRRYQPAIVVGIGTVCAMAGQFGWRLWYYGDLMPNTYYAKVSGSLGERLTSAQGVMSVIWWQTGIYLAITILASATLWQLWHKKGQFWNVPFRYWFFTAWLVYWPYVGGDIYLERFLVTLFPLAWITLCQAIRWVLKGNTPLRRQAQTCLIAGMLTIVVVTPRWITYEQQAGLNSTGWAFLGEILKREGPNETLAIDAAGKAPFVSGLRTIDMFGLNDLHIGRMPVEEGKFVLGHAKMDMDYVLNQKPRFIASWAGMDSVFGDSINLDTMKIMNLPYTTYKEQGYELYKLVNPNKTKSMPPPATASEWQIALMSGCNYAVLRRQDEHVALAANH